MAAAGYSDALDATRDTHQPGATVKVSEMGLTDAVDLYWHRLAYEVKSEVTHASSSERQRLRKAPIRLQRVAVLDMSGGMVGTGK